MKAWWILTVLILISCMEAQVSPLLNSPSDQSETTSQGRWHDGNSGDRMFFPTRHVLGLGPI